jgi:hypothetical protein
MRALALLFVFAVVFACIAVVAAPACAPLTDNVCLGDRVNALLSEDGGAKRAQACSRCLQQKPCCDVLGACDDTKDCPSEFQNMHRCVLAHGPAGEADCKAALVGSQSQALYACERSQCGAECGIPSCNLDPSVVLFVSPSCDRCISGACCDSVNACYKNRACKLFLECITDHCPVTIGSSMSRVETLPPEVRAASVAGVCGDAGVDQDAARAQFDPGPCLDRCLQEFTPPDTADDRAARCLAVGVYACGAGASCGASCMTDGGGTIGRYPEDDAGLN